MTLRELLPPSSSFPRCPLVHPGLPGSTELPSQLLTGCVVFSIVEEVRGHPSGGWIRANHPRLARTWGIHTFLRGVAGFPGREKLRCFLSL